MYPVCVFFPRIHGFYAVKIETNPILTNEILMKCGSRTNVPESIKTTHPWTGDRQSFEASTVQWENFEAFIVMLLFSCCWMCLASAREPMTFERPLLSWHVAWVICWGSLICGRACVWQTRLQVKFSIFWNEQQEVDPWRWMVGR